MTRQRRYYDPGANPRPRNPNRPSTHALKPRVPHTPADLTRKAAADAKRQRRAAKRQPKQESMTDE